MIYLFEDRHERLKQYYGSNKLPNGIVKATLNYSSVSEIGMSIYLTEAFPDAEGALFHKSYRGNDIDLLLGQIRDHFINQGLFFVFFSGGIESANYVSINGTWQASVNSRTFYNNLDSFAAVKDVRILCFGENFKINEYLNCIRDIRVELSRLAINPSQLISYIDISVMINVLTRYKGSFSELNDIIEKLINWLTGTETSISIEVFDNQVKKAFQPFLN